MPKESKITTNQRVELIQQKAAFNLESWKILALELPSTAQQIINSLLTYIEQKRNMRWGKNQEEQLQILKELVLTGAITQDLMYLLTLAICNSYVEPNAKRISSLEYEQFQNEKRQLLNEQANISGITRQLKRLLAGYDLYDPDTELKLYNLVVATQEINEIEVAAA